jgi:hypothetical protein
MSKKGNWTAVDVKGKPIKERVEIPNADLLIMTTSEHQIYNILSDRGKTHPLDIAKDADLSKMEVQNILFGNTDTTLAKYVHNSDGCWRIMFKDEFETNKKRQNKT